MKRYALGLVSAAAIATACYSFDYDPNGNLLCGLKSPRCPDGMYCAVDGKCWNHGEGPGTTYESTPAYTPDPRADEVCDQGDETRVTDYPNVSVSPSVVATQTGFAAVWEEHYFEDVAGELYFSAFDEQGAESGAHVRINVTEKARHPRLVKLSAGFALVYEISDTKEIFLRVLDETGAALGQALQVSDDDSSVSEHASAALLGDSLVIVWTDYRHGTAEIYGAVYDVGSQSFGQNTRLTQTQGDDLWPRIAATDFGFVVAAHESDANEIITVQLNASGVPVGDPSRVNTNAATYPIALAWNEQSLGVAWRDERNARIVFRLLDSNGAKKAGSSELTVADGLNELEIGYSYLGGLSMAWDGEQEKFVLARDAVPQTNRGDPNDAEIFVSRISADASKVTGSWRMSNDDGEPRRSTQPSLASGHGLFLVLWHDNRHEDEMFVDLSYDGEIHAATLSNCEETLE